MAEVKMVATDDMVLTNGKIYCQMVTIGRTSSPDNWWETSKYSVTTTIIENYYDTNTTE